MSAAIPSLKEKCKGAIVATAIGDALGWPVEQRSKNKAKKPKVNDYFVEWTRSCSWPAYHDERILPGEYSDDTQMTLAVARSIIAGNWEKHLLEKELPYWLQYERGGGSALLKAAKSAREGKAQLRQTNYAQSYFSAGGNGAAMRILPHVIASLSSQDTSMMMIDVIKDALITHGHPRAILGATCYAYALDYLLRKDTVLEYGELISALIDNQNVWGAFKEHDLPEHSIDVANIHANYNYCEMWESTRNDIVRQLDYISATLKKGLLIDDARVLIDLGCFGNASGAGDVAALAAIYLTSRYASNPTIGIKIPAFSYGADTDTIASMTGGLLGILNGTSWIPPEWKLVQDYDCLIQMASLLLADNKIEYVKSEVTNANSLDDRWITTPIGKMHLVEESEVPNGKRGVVVIEKWKTALGQTIYIKKLHLFTNRDQQHIENIKEASPDIQSPLVVQEQGPLPPAIQSISTQESAHESNTFTKQQKWFVLDSAQIVELLENPAFKNTITVGKVLKVVRTLLESDSSASDIARQFELDEAMVQLIRDRISISRD